MTHPTNLELQAWYDKALDDDEKVQQIVGHLKQCEVCTRNVDGFRVVEASVSAWAEQSEIDSALQPDLADWIFAQPDLAPKEQAERNGQNGKHGGNSLGVVRAVPAVTSGAERKVIPFTPRKKSAVLPVVFAGIPVMLAAAAVAVFAVTHPSTSGSPAQGSGNSNQLAQNNSQGNQQQIVPGPNGNGSNNHGETAPSPRPGPQSEQENRPEPMIAVNESIEFIGSEVIAVDFDKSREDSRTFSVLQVPGNKQGISLAVMWIEPVTENKVQP